MSRTGPIRRGTRCPLDPDEKPPASHVEVGGFSRLHELEHPLHTIAERLRSRVSLSLSGCLQWTGAITAAGYGAMRASGRVELVHRLAWAEEHGPIPDGLFVCHSCDNRRCIAIGHLFLGSAADNNADMVAKGRHGFTKVTDDDVAEIRRRFQPGAKFPSVASAEALRREFGISQTHVYDILKGAVRV